MLHKGASSSLEGFLTICTFGDLALFREIQTNVSFISCHRRTGLLEIVHDVLGGGTY